MSNSTQVIDLSGDKHSHYITKSPYKTKSAIVVLTRNNPKPSVLYYAPSGFDILKYIIDTNHGTQITAVKVKETGIYTILVDSDKYEVLYSDDV